MKIFGLLILGLFRGAEIFGDPAEDVDWDNSDLNSLVRDMTFPDQKKIANDIKEQKLTDYFNKINTWTNMINWKVLMIK